MELAARRISAVGLAMIIAACAGTSHAHTGTGFEPSFAAAYSRVEGGPLKLGVLFPEEMFARATGQPVRLVADLPAEARRELARRAIACVRTQMPLAVDGEVVPPVLSRIELMLPDAEPGYSESETVAIETETVELRRVASPWPMVKLQVTYPTDRIHRLVLHWKLDASFLEHGDNPELAEEVPVLPVSLLIDDARHAVRFTKTDRVFELELSPPSRGPAPEVIGAALLATALLLVGVWYVRRRQA